VRGVRIRHVGPQGPSGNEMVIETPRAIHCGFREGCAVGRCVRYCANRCQGENSQSEEGDNEPDDERHRKRPARSLGLDSALVTVTLGTSAARPPGLEPLGPRGPTAQECRVPERRRNDRPVARPSGIAPGSEPPGTSRSGSERGGGVQWGVGCVCAATS
jgi:hypothetical protein